MKKGSPEAKAWGRRMRAMRNKGSSKVNKRVSVKSSSRMSKRKSYGKKSKRAIHLVPDALAVMVPVSLVTEQTAGSSVIANVQNKDYSGAATVLMDEITSTAGLKAPVVFGIGALVAKWAGRKLGLSRIGTDEVKLF